MKKFQFPLDRVLAFRRTQAKLEAAKLERLHEVLRTLDARAEALQRDLAAARQQLASSGSVTGAELAALERYRTSAIAEEVRLAQARGQCQRQIAAQREIAITRQREQRLLEKLRDRRRAEWQADYAREQDRQAEESYLSRWNARDRS